MFAKLEDQMCSLTSDFDRRRAGYSPDRADALVWALTTLVVEAVPNLGLLQWCEQEAARLGLTGLLPGDPVPPSQLEQPPKVTMIAPPDWTGTYYGIDGTRYLAKAGEHITVTPDDVLPLQLLGFTPIHAVGASLHAGG